MLNRRTRRRSERNQALRLPTGDCILKHRMLLRRVPVSVLAAGQGSFPDRQRDYGGLARWFDLGAVKMSLRRQQLVADAGTLTSRSGASGVRSILRRRLR